MNPMNYDRKRVKERAKASLRGVQPRPWKVTLLAWVLVGLIPGVLTLMIQLIGHSGIFAYLQDIYADPIGWSVHFEAMNSEELLGYYRNIFSPLAGAGLISTFVTILVSLFRLVMSYGYANYGLKLYQGEQTETKDIFSGFPMAGRAICTGIVTFLLELLWTLLAVILGICATLIIQVTMYGFGDSGAVIVLGVLLMIVVWAAVFLFSSFISYRYALAPYFILTTDMGTMEAIRASKETMRGNLGRRFVLGLSFIGWEAVNGLIALGVMTVGYFVLIFVLSFTMVFQMVGVEGVISDQYANQMVGQMMTQMLVGVGIVGVVAEAATLPLGLWLSAYRGSAYAGFFLAVTGQEDASAVPPTPAYTYHPPVPPQPPQSGGMWDNVPQPPAFTTPAAPAEPAPAPEASQTKVEETPTAEDIPEMSQAPAAEVPAEEQTPAEEQAPVEERETGEEPQ